MKSTIFTAFIVLFSTAICAQGGFRIGLNAGPPVGDNGEFASFVANIEVEHDWAVTDIINVGASAGVTVYSGKEEFNDFKYAPLMASGDITVIDSVSLGVDLGYGVSLEEGFDGAFVYRFVGRYRISDHFDATARYHTFSSDLGDLMGFTIGVGYTF